MNNNSDSKVNKNLKFYVLHLPLCGIIISIVLAFFLMFNNVDFTLIVALYIIVPFLVHLLLFLIFKLFIHVNYKNISAKLYFISGISFLILICIICFYFFKPNQFNFTYIEPTELDLIEEQMVNSEQPYYFIYESHSCVLCNDMKPIYKEAFSKMKGSDVEVFVVNLSKLSLDDPIVTSRKINGIPLLVSCKEGRELKRTTGYQELGTVNQFLSERED